MKRLPCLTVWGCWAHSILYDGKTGENRSWALPASLVPGWLLLHAGDAPFGPGPSATTLSRKASWDRLRANLGLRPVTPAVLPRSQIFAAVHLVEVCDSYRRRPAPVSVLDNPWRDPSLLWWRWDRMIPLSPPLAASGHQGIWYCFENYRHDIEAAIAAKGAGHG